MSTWLTLGWSGWVDLPPVLPSLVWSQWLARISWALVVVWMGVGLSGRLRLTLRRALGFTLLVWMLLPSPWSPDYWLGLTFRIPSLTTDLLVALALVRALGPSTFRLEPQRLLQQPLWRIGAAAGVILGYLLLLDTLALLPWQMYRAGFGTAAFAVLGLIALLPCLAWCWQPHRASSSYSIAQRINASQPAILAVVLALYCVTRLPSGNVWDALLDPCLWLVLQVQLIRHYVASLRSLRRK